MADSFETNTVLLDDNKGNYGGVLFENRETVMVFALPKGVKPRPRALKLVREDKDGVGIYEVPKTDGFASIRHKLADGSTVQINRYLAIPRADREAMYADAVAKKIRILPLENPKADKDKGPARRLTIDSLK